MAADSKIEWTDHTFNPWIGCTKISIEATGGGGCDHCYAEVSTPVRVLRGKGAETWGAKAQRVRTSAANWALPKRWNAQANAFYAQHGRRQRVFCASLADVFDNAVDSHWRVDLFDLIAATPNLDWLLLTKRIGNVDNMLPVPFDFERLYPNVWIGATVVNQVEADRDIPKLLSVPAAKRFLSMEPLLGPVDIRDYMWPVHGWWRGPHNSYREAKAAGAECGLKRQALVSAHAVFLDWVIVGGESGAAARPMHPDWARSLRDQCAPAGVPFLFKQWGEWAPGANFADHIPSGESCDFGQQLKDDARSWKVGKKAAGRLLDGREWNEVPR